MTKKLGLGGAKALKLVKPPCTYLNIEQMYRKSNQSELTLENFELPVAMELSPDNRWVIMAKLIPWSEFEASMMVYFRERIKMDFVKKINSYMVKNFQEETEEIPTEEKKKKKRNWRK